MSGGEKMLVIKNEKKKICCQMLGTSVLKMRYV